MPSNAFHRLLEMRRGEAVTATLMFAYSFLAMTSYNIVKPLTKSKFIDQLGADNTPYVQLAAVVIIGLVMQIYSAASGRLRTRAVAPATLVGLAGLLVTFWVLFQGNAIWVSVAFYVFGFMFGILVISQFWTIANDIFDSRQARRLFGFIGGGASLGGALGNGLTGFFQDQIGENNLLLVSAAVLGLCIALVITVLRRQTLSADLASAGEERGVGGGEALRLLRESRHLQVIALVIGLATLAATLVDWQVNKTAEGSGSVSEFLARVGFYLSLTSFVVQVALTNLIHRSLGLVVALLILPLGLGGAAALILVTGAAWVPAVGAVLDRSLRYSLDKTTREVLFLPLSSDLKRRAKPFVDVTVDRLGKAVGAVLLLVLIKPWGLGLTWPQVSWASLAIIGLWIAAALVARREYLRSFRRSLDTREIEPAALRMNVADAATIEALVEELAHPDEASVLYAIDMLEMLDRRHLITPLLLHHQAPAVRARALAALQTVRPDAAARWAPAVQGLLKDPHPEVRAAAVQALAGLAHQDAATLMHQFLADADPGVAATAATVLADSTNPADPPVAFAALSHLIADDRAQAAPMRREAASALARIRNPDFRALLLPLLHDAETDVTAEAVRSAREVGRGDPRFVPALVSLLGHRRHKAPARAALVSFGDVVVPPLAHFLTDQGEHVWVRRHVPATLAAIPCQASMDALLAALGDPDGFLRFKIIEAVETLTREHPELTVPPAVIEGLVMTESARYYTYFALRFNLLHHDARAGTSLLGRALDDKLARTLDRVYRLLGLLYAWRDIAAARQALEGQDGRRRAHALEFLDNLLGGQVRRRVMPILDDLSPGDKVRIAHRVLRSRLRDLDDTLAQLVHEPDPVVAAAAVEFIEGRRLWSLADDLEFVVSHRTADRLVVEAAQWALASRGDGAGSGARANAPLPVVTLADRLRALPLFDFVSVDELFRIASTGRQVRYDEGRTVIEEGGNVDDVQFMIDGTARIVGGAAAPATIAAPAALGFDDMLEGRPVRRTVTAVDPVVCLCLSRPSLLTMMSDNIVLARGLFCTLMSGAETTAADAPRGAGDAARPLPAWQAPLERIEKARLLRHAPVFSRASVEQLLDLVAIAAEVTMVEGTDLFKGVMAPSVYYLLEGAVTIERPGHPPVVVGAGGSVGLAETLAGVPLTGTARVTAGGLALRIDQAPLFDVLADHMDLLQGLFSGVLNAWRGTVGATGGDGAVVTATADLPTSSRRFS
jgi:AAA family ATP:ADP antiporter